MRIKIKVILDFEALDLTALILASPTWLRRLGGAGL